MILLASTALWRLVLFGYFYMRKRGSLVSVNIFEVKHQNRCYDVRTPWNKTFVGKLHLLGAHVGPWTSEQGKARWLWLCQAGLGLLRPYSWVCPLLLPCPLHTSPCPKPTTRGSNCHPVGPWHILWESRVEGPEGQPGSLGPVLEGAQVVGLPPHPGPDTVPATFWIFGR